MPYVRSKKSYLRKRRSTSIRRKSAKRRKVTYRKRLSSFSKRVPKRVRKPKLSTGVFNSFGNKYVKSNRIGTVINRELILRNIIYANGSPGDVYLGKAVNVTVPAFIDDLKYAQADPGSSFAINWDSYAYRYQRAFVRSATVNFQFSIEDSESLGNSDMFIVGCFITHVNPGIPLTSYGDFSRIIRCGNVVYKKWTKNVKSMPKITATVNVGGCLQTPIENRYSLVWGTQYLGQNNVHLPELYPRSTDLYVVPFVSPCTRSVGPEAPVNVQYRCTVYKKVHFSRPISDPAAVRYWPNYPPVTPLLPQGYAPQPLDSLEEDLDALEAKFVAMEAADSVQDDQLIQLTSRMDIDDLEDGSVQSATNFNSGQVNNLTSQLDTVTDDLGTVSAQTDQNTIQIVSLSGVVDENYAEFVSHQALPANQGHA